jgi:hypothetical protein
MSFLRSKPVASIFTDSFSVQWAALVARSKKLRLFRKRSDHADLVAEFEALIADRKAHDDLPYAGEVLGRAIWSAYLIKFFFFFSYL